MKTNKKLHQLCAAAAVLSIGALGFSTSAMAVEPGPDASTTKGAVEGTIPATLPALNQSTNLRVHKHEQPTPAGAAGDGTEKNAPTTKAIAGVTFKVQKLTAFDLTTNEGWVNGSKVAEKFNENHDTSLLGALDTGSSELTNADGVASFDALTPGYYLVSEVGTSKSPAGSLVPAKPFVVALPLTNPDDTTKWLDTVHVYPKNEVIKIEKGLADNKVQLGGDVTYTLTSSVPLNMNGKYVVVDKLSESAKLKEGAEDITVTAAGVDLTSADYTLTKEAHKLVVTFNESGLKKLAAERATNADLKVVVTLKATLESFPADGNIDNVAYLAPSADFNEEDLSRLPSSEQPDPTKPYDDNNAGNKPAVPSNKVTTKLGQVKVIKFEAGAEGTKLNDAVFKLNYCDDLNTNLTVGTANTFTTGENGEVTIQGLQLTNFANNAAVNDGREFCLTETKAPAGYELLPEAIRFTLKDANQTAPLEIKVPNTKKNGGFNLPLTGANGLITLGVAGAALAGGGALLIVARRRNNH
ncbi:hypothetical protein BSR29_06810 [Boudabousia liubingyangii]|uniref:Gram-positive cocci surface proteins LPxTG domain-containing protein n=1 Tax=Boudabousia liubingyangii TaxID=1921764 RepID=A0A1Q5PL05_9ACTO|nr:SpaH/EbpB family LPXTG-anchored major pilin [Boudabousia liubingyangii]OKL47316.1 hypothetical protein BSR29_06810 [Boudabousia liubingyangii]